MIYLDNASTTPMSQPALDVLYQVSQDVFANPSSIHGHGRQSNHILRQSRQAIAHALNTDPNQIIFTSGGSEANNLAIKGYALANRDKGMHLITTSIEHHSVLHTMDYLTKHWGFDITFLQPQDGEIKPQQVKEALRDDTILVSIMHTNNETGLSLPIHAIGEILSDHPAVFHVDAVQVMGKLPLNPHELGVDMLSASAHKFHGPKGVGFLYTNTNSFQPAIHGGSQESKRRAGTENLAGIASMAKALTDSLSNWKDSLTQVEQLRNDLFEGLKELTFYQNSDQDSFPYVVNLGFPNCSNTLLLTQLDLAGISVSSGSACTAGTIEPSHVLSALYGNESERLKESIRISFSKMTLPQDVDILTQKIKEILGD